MAETKNYGISGVSSELELGKGNSRIKESGGAIEHRNAADDAYVIARGATPVGDNDLVTKKFLDERASVYVSAQIDGSVPTPAAADWTFALVTTAGNGFLLNEVYKSDGSTWNEITIIEGMVISVTDALTGGTDEYEADHRYLRDEDGSTWVDLGASTAITKVMKAERATLAFGSSSPLNIGAQLPSNAIVTKVVINVSSAFDGASESTLEIGDSWDTDRLAASSEINLAVPWVYVIDTYHLYGSSTQVTGTYVQDSATTWAAEITLEYSII